MSLYENVFHFSGSNNSIILCDAKSVLKTKSFKEVIYLSDVLHNELSKHFTHSIECVGLFMDHNIYLPSIIMSLQRFNKNFVIMSAGHLADSNLQLNWILSFQQFQNLNYEKCAELSLDNNVVFLWKQTLYLNIQSESVFCVMQSSGSTGKSKLIKIPYDCIQKNTESLNKIFKIDNLDVIFWGTPLTFDPSLIELLLGLLNGACLVIVPRKVFINPYLLFEALFNVANITFLQIVPSVFLRWDDLHQGLILNNRKLRVLAFGGECFPAKILNMPKQSTLKLFNLYGITELSCWATLYELESNTVDGPNVPLGNALDDTIIEVRNEIGEHIFDGLGEIFVGSSTRKCIVDDEKLDEFPKTKFRATGDIAKINEKGLFYQYRKTRLIKRFGQRINLTKIEQQIIQTTGLVNRCIWITNMHKLVAYVVIDNFLINQKEKILDKLGVKILNALPEASFPDHFDLLQKLPVTSHGKIDDKTLEKIYKTFMKRTTHEGSNDKTFTNLCCKYLGVSCDVLSELKNQNFIELGGTSITVLQLNNELIDILQADVPDHFLKYIFECSLKDCCAFLLNYKQHRRKKDDHCHLENKKLKHSEDFKVLWKYDLKACVDSSPLVFQKNGKFYVAVGSFSHLFVILDENGDEIMKLSMPDIIQTAAVVSETCNLIFVGCFDGCMYCIDFIEKRIFWKFRTGNIIVSSPQFIRNKSAIVFGSYDESIYCLQINVGVKLWNTSVRGSIAVSPLVDDSQTVIFVATTRGHCYCFDQLNGSIKWHYENEEPIFGTPVKNPNGETIIFPTVHCNLISLSVHSGQLLWKFKTDGMVFSSIVSHIDCLIFGCHDEHFYIVKPDVDSCSLVTKIKVQSVISTSVFMFEEDNITYIVAACNAGVIYIIDSRSYKIVTNMKLPGEIFSSPVVIDKKMYIGCRDNNLYCIDMSEFLIKNK